jgi:hypothetical protein
MGPICCPETSVKVYHSTLRNTPEERRSHQHRGVSLKSQTEKKNVTINKRYKSSRVQLRNIKMREYEHTCDLRIKQNVTVNKYILKIIEHHITCKLA